MEVSSHLAVYAVSTQPVTESPTQVTIGAQSPSNDLTAEEPYAGFNAQIQQILSEADALHNEVDRQGLKEVLQPRLRRQRLNEKLKCGRPPQGNRSRPKLKLPFTKDNGAKPR